MRLASLHSVAIASAAALLPAAFATESPEEIFVTATRAPTPVADIAVPVIIITRADIEKSLASDVGTLLAQHAGLEVARNGGPGQTASLFIRGANSDHAVVLIDGVRINPGTIGGAAIQNIAPESIERIEIVKGPRSALYGTDAIGGVVNIFTRAAARRGVTGMLSMGRYGTEAAFLEGGGALGTRAAVGFSVGGSRSDGFPTLRASAEDRGYRNLTLNLFGEVAASDALKVRARAWRAAGSTEYSDFLLAPVDQDYENSAYSLEAELTRSPAMRAQLALAHVTDVIDQNQSDEYLRTRRDSLDLQTDWTRGLHNLTAGALLTRENARALSFGLGFNVDTSVNMAFLQDRVSHGAHDLLFAAGYTDHETFGGTVTWNAEYAYEIPGPRTRLAVAAGRAFHAPDSTDRFGFGGNPDLRPELSRQIEVTLRQPFGAAHSVFLTAYRNDVDDLINYVVTDFATFDGRNENVEQARLEGLEFGYEFRGRAWRARAEATLSDPLNRTTGEPLLRRARERLVLSVARNAGKLEMGADLLWAGTRRDFGSPQTRLSDYAKLDLALRYALHQDWILQAAVENVLDERYELANGYNSPRRTLTLATRLRMR